MLKVLNKDGTIVILALEFEGTAIFLLYRHMMPNRALTMWRNMP